ncbi:hypothetical protein MKW98_032574 [Papaver atlanticum]|uniref:GATA-type domain-containing protein n=1 Tax=Papaver atlanticum TaxID=357466 RepID=A0AAD4XLL2_9MAGN|nr:hypothetical protein MKW98_032574 [Papaver atlanticum]
MDFYRNMSVVIGGGDGVENGGFPSPDYQPEQFVVSPSSTTYSKLGVVSSSSCCSVDDLFSTQNMEQEAGDVNIEWLSNLVEDCLSNTGNCINQPLSMNDHQPLNVKKHYSSVSLTDYQNHSTAPTAPSLQNFLSIPTGNSRTKRRRTAKLPRKPFSSSIRSSTSSKNNSRSSSWSSHHQEEKDPQNQNPNHHHVVMTSEYMTPLLVHQAYWLADSELINVPQNENTNNNGTFTTTTIDEDDEREEIMMKMEEEEEGRRKDSLGNLGQPRRCTHCLSQRTPQWRAGPLGPKTLCNACGVRFKSGRLLPEYRPAKSPTFVSYKHSNSHKKVLEMRMSILPSSIHSE